MAKKTLSYLPQIINLKLYAGDGSGMRFTITDTAGAPLPLTGEMKAQIRASREAVDPPLAELDVDLTDFAIGKALVSITGDQTHDLITGNVVFNGVWDLQWTPTGDEPMTLVQGDVECFPDVTH